jgi:hypothetical protein
LISREFTPLSLRASNGGRQEFGFAARRKSGKGGINVTRPGGGAAPEKKVSRDRLAAGNRATF